MKIRNPTTMLETTIAIGKLPFVLDVAEGNENIEQKQTPMITT